MMFKEPNNSIWLFVLLPMMLIMIKGYKKRKKNLSLIVDKTLWGLMVPNLSYSRRFWKRVLTISALICVIVALMRPQYGVVFKKMQRKGNDIFIAIDTSKSMGVKDIKPSRFEHAKREVYNLIEELKGDRIGIIAFAGEAFIQCPMTLDYSALKLFIDHLDIGSAPVAGTDIATAIKTARLAFERTSKANNKILIIISDGEGFENDPIKSAEVAKDAGIEIYTIGIGTAAGEPIPIYQNDQFEGYKKDKNNKVVLSKLDKQTLTQVAYTASGKYYSSDLGQFVMDQVYKDLSIKETSALEEELLQTFAERYQWVLAIAFLCLLIELLISDLKVKKQEWQGRLTQK